MYYPNVTMRETDLSVVRIDGSPAFNIGMEPPANVPRKKKRYLTRRKQVQIVRLSSRWYTNTECATLLVPDVPSRFRFRHARAAKRFFNKGPLMIRSLKQMVAIFGQPQRS